MFTQEQEIAALRQLDQAAKAVLAGEKHISSFFSAYKTYLESRNIISKARQSIYDMVGMAANYEIYKE